MVNTLKWPKTVPVWFFLEPVRDERSSRGCVGLSQMFRFFEANSGSIQLKGYENLAKSSVSAVDLSYVGQAPRASGHRARRET